MSFFLNFEFIIVKLKFQNLNNENNDSRIKIQLKKKVKTISGNKTNQEERKLEEN